MGRPPGFFATAIVGEDAPRTYERVSRVDPTRFYPAFGPLPAVVEVRDQSGGWRAVGETRTLVLSDGGSVRERITHAERGEVFAYDLSGFEGVFGKLVSGARAVWRFEQLGRVTRVTWSYEFVPLPRRGPIVAAIVALAWAPYMRRVLPAIAREAERR